MTYRYRCEIRTMDYWLLSMYHTYHSMIGMCNLVLLGASVALTVRFWNEVNVNVQVFLVLFCLLIPVFHPAGVWMKARSRAKMTPQNTEMAFSDQGIYVTLDGKHEMISWNKVKGAKKEGNMVILFTGGGHGYMLTDHVLGEEKEEFYNYVKARVYTGDGNHSDKRRKSK
ncbi:MAG: YcxB family protein [Lachnospiraceae bacterium]|nr:YcxB family protein [Lachnospiraceae bacterium]